MSRVCATGYANTCINLVEILLYGSVIIAINPSLKILSTALPHQSGIHNFHPLNYDRLVVHNDHLRVRRSTIDAAHAHFRLVYEWQFVTLRNSYA